MATTINTNFGILAPNPIDDRYNSTRLSSGRQLPYSGITEVISIIPESRRYPGLTVLIDSGATAVEYWFREGVADGDLIPKTIDVNIPEGAFITGATNIGYFSGYTGVQILPIDNLADNNYDGDYCSLYNYYYRDADAIIRTGAPSGCVERRGYYNLSKNKSWIWNNRNSSGELMGWIFVDGNVENLLGTTPSVATYYPSSAPYSAITWNTGSLYNNGSNAVINTVVGSLSTGATLCIGGRPFACVEHNNLHFRTVISDTPNLLSVRDDESFIRISGKTSVLTASSVGTGEAVLSGQTATELYFRRIRGSGGTTVTTVGDSIVITASGGTGGGTYDLSSPAAICVGGIDIGTSLTGKTAFQLFEQLLVPELCGVITEPSISNGLSASGLYEVGCTVSQTVTGTFNRGAINPQYCSISPFRSGCVNAYSFTGTGMPSGWQLTTASPYFVNNPSYVVSAGTQTWGVCARYDEGSPALGSKGTEYCAALPSGITAAASDSIVGVYPLFATCSDITLPLEKISPLYDMATANNIYICVTTESGGNKQKFEIPCAWLSSRPLVGVCQWNTVSSQWEYPGGSAGSSLNLWCACSVTETIQGNSIGYCQYSHCCSDRDSVCIRLVF